MINSHSISIKMKAFLKQRLLFSLVFSSLFFFLLLPHLGEATSSSLPLATAELEKQVADIFSKRQTVGGAFVVAYRGDLVYEQYYGY
ncbi:MAG: hypothetical protein GX786_01470, partial [Clostridiales bacterium]|nr:hypothetical protein [Clostridiales bacterium]